MAEDYTKEAVELYDGIKPRLVMLADLMITYGDRGRANKILKALHHLDDAFAFEPMEGGDTSEGKAPGSGGDVGSVRG